MTSTTKAAPAVFPGAPAAGARVDDLRDLGALALVGEPHPGAQALAHRGVAAVAAEHEGDGGQQPGAVQPLDDVGVVIGRPCKR